MSNARKKFMDDVAARGETAECFRRKQTPQLAIRRMLSKNWYVSIVPVVSEVIAEFNAEFRVCSVVDELNLAVGAPSQQPIDYVWQAEIAHQRAEQDEQVLRLTISFDGMVSLAPVATCALPDECGMGGAVAATNFGKEWFEDTLARILGAAEIDAMCE